jgi:hypothetical protein
MRTHDVAEGSRIFNLDSKWRVVRFTLWPLCYPEDSLLLISQKISVKTKYTKSFQPHIG